MGIIAAGQITVVDLSDAPVLNTFITASRPTTQTYSKDSRTYNPSYASTPQVLTLKVTKAGSTANIIDSISSLHWFVVDGPIKTEITSKDNSANEYISGTHNEILTTKLDIDLNKGSKRYEVMGIWPDPSTGLDVQFGGYIDLLLTQNGATGPQGPQGNTGNGIANTVVTYGLSMSDTTEPATWSSEMPTLVKGMYLWTRTVIIYTNGNSTTSYQISYIAKDADATAEIDKAKQELLEKLETVRDDSLEAVDEAKQQLVAVRDESLAAAEEAKQGLINVNTKVDNAKAEIDKAKQDLTNVASELNTAKQDLADSVTAVNTKVDNAKADLTQAKQQLTTVADDLNTAKQDFQNAVSAVDTKATNLKSDLAQAKQDLASQAQQLQEQATAQSELTNRVSSVEETANGTKTTVSELSKTVAQNGKDITSVTNRTKTVEDDLANTKTTLTQVQTTANSASQKTATLETGLNGLSAKFENLKIGGRNLLSKTNRGKTNWSWKISSGGTTAEDYNVDGINAVKLTRTSDASFTWDYIQYNGLMRKLIEPDTKYTLSFDVKPSVDVTFGASLQRGDGGAKLTNAVNMNKALANKWSKVSCVLTTKTTLPDDLSQVVYLSGMPVANGNWLIIKNIKLEKGNIATDYSPNEADLEQKVAEYKQNADQNYASLQTTVQNLDGTVQHNKTVAEQTAAGFKTRIESLETYKDGESERANAYFQSAKTETAKQLTAERTAIANNYVAKSTYTSDVTGIRNELSATTSTANTTKTNLANYQASNDRAVASLQSNLQTANGNISSLKTKVEAVPGQITSAVSAVEGKIPTSAGGRNLALGTSADWSNGRTSFNGQVNQVNIIYRIYNRGFKIGDKVNVRLVLKYSGIAAAEGQTPSGIAQCPGNVTHWGRGGLDGGTSFLFDGSNGEIELKGTTVVDEYIIKNEYWNWQLRIDYVASGKIQWKEAKAEVGDLPTPWSPAPEDTVEQISNLSSEIKQTADGITLLATKTELNSAKNELQSGINTATNKANSAQNTANSNAQTISTHTTQISALNTGLQAKVSQTDFNTLSGRVTTAENNITAKANELTSKITSVEGKIPTSIGGRNLWIQSKTTGGFVEETLPDNHITGQKKCYRIPNNAEIKFNIEPNFSSRLYRKVTFSAWVKYENVVQGENSWNKFNCFKHELYYKNSSTGATSNINHLTLEGFTGTSDWKYITYTYDYAANKSYDQLKTSIRFNLENVRSGTAWVTGVKIEIGSIPSDYSPAPEVTDTQISSLSSELKQTKDGITLLATKTELNTAKNELQSGINTATNKANNNAQTISTHTTQISALNTGLQAKVSQSDFNTLSGRVTTAENNITAKANELSSKITSVEGKIPTTVGGRNLALGTRADWSNGRTSFNGQVNQVNIIYRIYNRGFKIGDKVNVRIVLKYSDIVAAEGRTPSGIAQCPGNVTNWGRGGLDSGRSFNFNGSNGEIELKGTTVVDEYIIKNEYWNWQLRVDYVASGKIQWKEAKAEIGDLPTPWSPAPEDTAEQISNLSSEIKQTADGMTLLATKTELNTAKNELQSGINTATNKANSAQNTANNNAQTISTHTTQISALNTGLQAKVSQTDFNTLSGRVTTAENNITAKANELSSKITSVEGKIPTNIGTVNLVKDTGSAFVMGYGITNTTWNETKKQSILDFSVPGVRRDITSEILPQGNKFCDFKPIKGTTYTQSMMIDTDATFYPNGQAQCTWFANGHHNGQKAYIKKVGAYSYQVWSTYTWDLENTALRAFDWWNLHAVLGFRNSGTYLAFYKPKLTTGNLPSDWSPAPEDTISQISSLSSELKQTKDGITLLATKTELNSAKNELQSGINTATNKANAAQNTANNNAQTINTHTTQISALNTGLQAKVSQTEFNTLSGRVTSAENNITAKANELSSKITSVEGKIPTSVGGRNLWIQSKVTGSFVEETLPDNHITGQKKCYRISNNNEISFNIEPDFSSRLYRKVTFSAWVKYDNVAQGSNNWNVFNCFKHSLYYKNSSTGATSNINHLTLEGFTGTSGWKYITYTYDYAANKSYDQLKTSIRFNLENVRSGTAWVTGVKVEIGSIPSDYTPAPEDTAEQINAVSSELKQTKDGITLLATKTELNSAKNELQSGINTATNKANAAQNKANSNAQTISTHTNQISALNTGLQAKVSQTDFNTLSGRVTTAENNITAKANELSSKITKVEGKIPTSSGGRNLAQGTSKDWSKPFTGFSGNKNTCPSLYRVTTDGLVVGDTIKTRIVLKYTDIRPASGKTAEIWLQGAGNVTEWNSGAYPSGGGGRRSLSGSGEIVFELTDKIIANHLKNSYWDLSFRTDWIASGSLQWRLAKVERGMFFTDWSPAPEDTINQINSVSSELKQTTDAIKASVTSLDKSTVKSSSLTINSDGIVMKAGKSTTDVANAIGSYFAVNQNAINLFSDKINVKGSMIVNGTITGDKIKASSVDVSKIVGIDANFIKSKIEYAMIDWLKGKTITAYNDNMTIDLQNGRISFKDGSNAVYRQTSDGIHTGFLHFEAGPQGGIQAAFGATSMRQFINSKTSAFAGIRCYRVSAHGDSHEAKIDKIELIGDVVQFGHGYASEGNIGGGFIMDNAIYREDKPYSLNRMVRSIESLWRILHDHARNVGYNLSDQHFINALNDEYNAWYDMHNK